MRTLILSSFIFVILWAFFYYQTIRAENHGNRKLTEAEQWMALWTRLERLPPEIRKTRLDRTAYWVYSDECTSKTSSGTPAKSCTDGSLVRPQIKRIAYWG